MSIQFLTKSIQFFKRNNFLNTIVVKILSIFIVTTLDVKQTNEAFFSNMYQFYFQSDNITMSLIIYSKKRFISLFNV